MLGIADAELFRLAHEGRLSKGIFFELCVLKIVEHLAQTGGLGFQRDALKVFHGKRYPSNSGGDSFQADVSVEVFRPFRQDPMLIVIWECKNHSRRIGRAQVQKFFSDIQEIGASRTKGILATPHGLSRWAMAFARKHGIGVWPIQMPRSWELLDVAQMEDPSNSDSLESFIPGPGAALGCLAVGFEMLRSVLESNQRRY